MKWEDIDPEKRDLSTPELWDAWRDEVAEAIPDIDKWRSKALPVSENVFATRGQGWSPTRVVINMKRSDGTMWHHDVMRPMTAVDTLERRLKDALERIAKLEHTEEKRAERRRRCPKCGCASAGASTINEELVSYICGTCWNQWPIW